MSESPTSQLKMVLDRESASQARHDIKVSALEAKIERLREALKPFAARANVYDPAEDDDETPEWSDSRLSPITVGDLRRARAAIGE